MDIHGLRYFVTIVESGSLSKASAYLHIAQPALSQQLAKLEHEVGRPLLTRTARGVIPTRNGISLYNQARYLLRQFDQTLKVARNEPHDIQGTVAIGLPATTVAAIGMPLIKRIRARYPGILLNVVEAMSGHVAQLMRSGQLDLAVLFGDNIAPEMTVEPLMIEELFLILMAQSRLLPRKLKAVTMAKAAELPMILPTASHGLRQRIEAEFESRGHSLEFIAEIDSLSLVMSCVQDDIGATIKPMGAVMSESMRGRMWRCLPFSDVQMRRRNYLYSLPSDRQTAAAAIVTSELKHVVAELTADKTLRGFSVS